MKYFLFIDDTRRPSDIYSDTLRDPWIVAKNFEDIKRLLLDFGYPEKISFDTDMGHDSVSGLDIVKCLCEIDLENSNSHLSFPVNFSFRVHSNNLEANKNIESYLENYLLKKKESNSIKEEISKIAFGI